MSRNQDTIPGGSHRVSRRSLLKASGAAALAGTIGSRALSARAAEKLPEPLTHPAREIPSAELRVSTEVLPLGIETNRLRSVNFDGEGTAWIALVESDRRKFLKAGLSSLKEGRPATLSRVTEMLAGDRLYMDNIVPVGPDVFVTGGHFPRQIVFDKKTGVARDFPMKVANPEIFNAIVLDGLVYAVDGNNGIHVWTPGEWTSELIPWPRPGKGPFSAVYVRADRSLYCPMWWIDGMPETQTLLRYDLAAKSWSTLTPPWKGTKPMSPVEIDGSLYMTDMFGGFVLVFDIKSQQFTSRHRLVGHDRMWKYAASFHRHGQLLDCTVSTFAGVKNERGNYGFDGGVHHFVNQRLLFDPRDGASALVEVPSASGKGYPTVAYSQPRGDALYLTCVDSPRVGNRPAIERGPAYLVEMKVQRNPRAELRVVE